MHLPKSNHAAAELPEQHRPQDYKRPRSGTRGAADEQPRSPQSRHRAQIVEINVRRNLTSAWFFHPPSIIELQHPHASEPLPGSIHLVFPDGTEGVERDGPWLQKTCAGKRVLALDHGYANNRASAHQGALDLIDLLTASGIVYDVILIFQWPARTKLGYIWADLGHAGKAGRELAAILAGLDPAALDVQGHSLGCRLSLEAVGALQNVRNLILANAAVDNEVLGLGEEFGDLPARSVLVVFSIHDPVLKTGYRLGSIGRNWKRLFTLKWGDTALGYSGPENPKLCPPNVRAEDCSSWLTSHGGARHAPQYGRLWRSLMPDADLLTLIPSSQLQQGMRPGEVYSLRIEESGVNWPKIADYSVSTTKIADCSVSDSNIRGHTPVSSSPEFVPRAVGTQAKQPESALTWPILSAVLVGFVFLLGVVVGMILGSTGSAGVLLK